LWADDDREANGMVLSRSVALFNRRVTNKVLGPVAARLPWFGIVHHVGRKSGTEYRTPVNVFRVPDGYAIALTYGPGSDWVRNMLAAGGGELAIRGVRHRLGSPRLVHDEKRSVVGPLPRLVLGAAGVADFLFLDEIR
jgi:deazaflavin-dependent oxidoreductase (nitroreductase family)